MKLLRWLWKMDRQNKKCEENVLYEAYATEDHSGKRRMKVRQKKEGKRFD